MNIIWTNPAGEVGVTRIITNIDPLEHAEELRVRGAVPADWQVAGINKDCPIDSMFRASWRYNGVAVYEDLDMARTCAHNARRIAREQELAPHDAVIAKQIPGTDIAAVEAIRATIREKYAGIQSNIDTAGSVDALRSIVKELHA